MNTLKLNWIARFTDEGESLNISANGDGEFLIDDKPLPYATADSVEVNAYAPPVPAQIVNNCQEYIPGKAQFAVMVDGKPFVVLGLSASETDRRFRVAYIGFDGPVQVGITPQETSVQP